MAKPDLCFVDEVSALQTLFPKIDSIFWKYLCLVGVARALTRQGRKWIKLESINVHIFYGSHPHLSYIYNRHELYNTFFSHKICRSSSLEGAKFVGITFFFSCSRQLGGGQDNHFPFTGPVSKSNTFYLGTSREPEPEPQGRQVETTTSPGRMARFRPFAKLEMIVREL